MLVFVGLGLHDGGISQEGLREAREAGAVYAELYTSLIPGLDVGSLERLIGRPLKVVDREVIEGAPDEILKAAKREKVVLLVPGDPMMATTHVDLRLRAAKAGITTKIVHAGTIVSAAAGVAGFQSYKFGPSATVPFPDNPSTRPYEVLSENKQRGLHTLLLLDLRLEKGQAMSANEAMRTMLDLESKFAKGAFTKDTLVVVVARAGAEDGLVKAGRVKNLLNADFGPPPHVLLVPGKLHFLEVEALRVFAGAPTEALDEVSR
jgi:diphthine synthase